MNQQVLSYEFSVELLDNQVLLLGFNSTWNQDDMVKMKEVILKKLPSAEPIETLLGADRESVRFSWRSHVFMLHFECYSQSCWIEAESEQSHKLIDDLKGVLNY